MELIDYSGFWMSVLLNCDVWLENSLILMDFKNYSTKVCY